VGANYKFFKIFDLIYLFFFKKKKKTFMGGLAPLDHPQRLSRVVYGHPMVAEVAASHPQGLGVAFVPPLELI
jgi:hypothetical protein